MGVGGQRHFPAYLPPGMTRYPLYRRLGRPHGRSGRVLKISPPPGFDPQTVQLVASRYTGYAIPAHFLKSNYIFLCKGFSSKFVFFSSFVHTPFLPVVKGISPVAVHIVLKCMRLVCHIVFVGHAHKMEP
jgi:hypothetical protein